MKLTHRILDLHLSQPFVSNKGSLTRVRQVLIRLEWHGVTGMGTSGPVTDASATVDALQRCAPRLAGLGLHQLCDVHIALSRIEPCLEDEPAALSAIDMACHDLLGKWLGVPLHVLFGYQDPNHLPSALSLAAAPTNQLVTQAAAAAEWPILKLKMTASVELDQALQRVDRIRDVYAGRLWIDANGAWEPAQAVAAAEALARRGVELLEQPIRAGCLDRLRFVRDRAPIPIAADEDCVWPGDIARLAGCVDIVNIKLLKCGGLRRAVRMLHDARRAGLSVMLGCKTESVLGISAMAHLGRGADYLDLDGHLDLIDDPFVGVEVRRGKLYLPETPGIGVRQHTPFKEDI